MSAGMAGTVILTENPPVAFAVVVATKMKLFRYTPTSPLDEASPPETVMVLPTDPLEGVTVTVMGAALTPTIDKVVVSNKQTEIIMDNFERAIFLKMDSADIFFYPKFTQLDVTTKKSYEPRIHIQNPHRNQNLTCAPTKKGNCYSFDKVFVTFQHCFM
jgi:hypothetical protein